MASHGGASAKPPKLLTLPRELRNIIYEFTFYGEVNIDQVAQASGNYVESTKALNKGILATCRQLRAEASDYYKSDDYYRKNVFYAKHNIAFHSWIRSLSTSQRHLLQDVRIERQPNVSSNISGRHLLKRVKITVPAAIRDTIKVCFFDAQGDPTWAREEPQGFSWAWRAKESRSICEELSIRDQESKQV